jgi:hypothetical protein
MNVCFSFSTWKYTTPQNAPAAPDAVFAAAGF